MDKEQKLSQDVKETFGSAHGKRVWAKLRSLSTIDRSSVSPDRRTRIDVNRLLVDEGARSVILYIEKHLNKDLSKKKQGVAKNDRGS